MQWRASSIWRDIPARSTSWSSFSPWMASHMSAWVESTGTRRAVASTLGWQHPCLKACSMTSASAALHSSSQGSLPLGARPRDQKRGRSAGSQARQWYWWGACRTWRWIWRRFLECKVWPAQLAPPRTSPPVGACPLTTSLPTTFTACPLWLPTKVPRRGEGEAGMPPGASPLASACTCACTCAILCLSFTCNPIGPRRSPCSPEQHNKLRLQRPRPVCLVRPAHRLDSSARCRRLLRWPAHRPGQRQSCHVRQHGQWS